MWPNLQETVDLVTFTEEILNKNFHFLCSGCYLFISCFDWKIDVFQQTGLIIFLLYVPDKYDT